MSLDRIFYNLKNGLPIIIIDDKDREDEGDIVFAAETVDSTGLAFAVREARGLMCIPCDGEILDRLEIPMMVTNSTDRQGTPFTVSVDAIAPGMTTGMPVVERMKTISVFLDENSKPEDLARPGHMFPLRPKPGLLNDRRGHTEASVALMKLANLKPVAIIIEILNDDGTMARGESLHSFAEKFDIPVISVEEIANVCNKGL